MRKLNDIDIQPGDLVKFKDISEECLVIKVEGIIALAIDTNGEEFNFYTNKAKYISEVKRPCQYKTIYKREEILTDEEREYLSAVIKPFRDRFRDKIYFMKRCDFFDKEHMTVWVDGEFSSDFRLPSSQENTKYKYKNMKLRKRYTLEELGL